MQPVMLKRVCSRPSSNPQVSLMRMPPFPFWITHWPTNGVEQGPGSVVVVVRLVVVLVTVVGSFMDVVVVVVVGGVNMQMPPPRA